MSGRSISLRISMTGMIGMIGVLGLVGVGCRPRVGTAPDAGGRGEGSGASDAKDQGYPGPLLDPELLGPDFQWRQRVTAQWDTAAARSFEAVLSKTDGELLLLGLSPMGTPGFVLRLRGGAVEFENHSPQRLPFEPSYIMLDVERVFFPWMDGEGDGTREHTAHGERITEIWDEGRLKRRTFERLDGQPKGTIIVEYDGWNEGDIAPATARLHNGWFGYTLTIETLEQQRL